jgi:cytidylate kinase
MAVAIDGPAGAGKSTVGRELARRLGWMYVDTGAMYRAATLKAMRLGVDFDNAEALARVADEADIRLTPEDDTVRVWLDCEDVTGSIRTPELTARVRFVAACSGARAALVKKQRAVCATSPAVMEGRDIGTVVLTDAVAKFYLDASVDERARRRALDLKARGVDGIDVEEVKRNIASRDKSDMEREDSPLRKADDAEIIDTDGLGIYEVVDRLERFTREKVDALQGQGTR